MGVVATDDSRCSTIGVSMLRQGGHAVDAAVAAALCIGVVFSASSGIGGGAFTACWLVLLDIFLSTGFSMMVLDW